MSKRRGQYQQSMSDRTVQGFTPAMQRCILREYDRTLGGVEIVSCEQRRTLDALHDRGCVGDIAGPQWDGGPWTARLTETGLEWRRILAPARVAVPLDPTEATE